MFVKNAEIRDFYMNQIEKLLENYEPGDPKMKPDVISQIARMDKERAEEAAKHGGNNAIIAEDGNGKQVQLSNQQIVELIQNLQNENGELKKGINSQNQQLQDVVKQANEKIQDVINQCNQQLHHLRNEVCNLEKENAVYKESQKKQLLLKKKDYINFDKKENIQINICEKSISNEVKEELENKMRINEQYCNNDNCAETTKNTEGICDDCIADESGTN